MTKAPEIQCQVCSGKGVVPMSESLLDTFNIVKKLRKAKAVEVLAESKDDVTLSAICNRLDDLHERGILERSKSGRFFFYSICHSKASHRKN